MSSHEDSALESIEAADIPVVGVPESAMETMLHEDVPVEHNTSAATEEPTIHHAPPMPNFPAPELCPNVAEMIASPPTPPPSVVPPNVLPASVVEMPCLPRTPPLAVVENKLSLPSPPDDLEIEPTTAVDIPMQIEETTSPIPEDMVIDQSTVQELPTPADTEEDIIMEEVALEATVLQAADPEDMITEETIPVAAPIVPSDDVGTPQQQIIPDVMVTEETHPVEFIPVEAPVALPKDMEVDKGEAVPEEMVTEGLMPGEAISVEVLSAPPVGMEVDRSEHISPDADMQVDPSNYDLVKKKTPFASWYANPPKCKGTKRSIVQDHYGEQRCQDQKRGRDRGRGQHVVYPADASLERFQAEVRLFPPVRLQLMLNSYMEGRLRGLDPSSAKREAGYLERVIRTPEQSDRDYSFEACWRTYAASRPHGQREPPFTLSEAIDLVTSCLVVALPHGGWLVRRAEQDFREELQIEVKQRHEDLKKMSWSSSWFCPRHKPPHLAEDPRGTIQRFSRDYARRFLYHILDADNLKTYCLRQGGESDTKDWANGAKMRSDFISIKDPQIPWCLRRAHDFRLLATWEHSDLKDCRGFIQFTNIWFGECIARDCRPAAASLFRLFDKDRCDWLKHHAGAFPQKKP